MNPVSFSCIATLNLAPDDIARQILDVTKWTEFKGYGPLPGIKAAQFEIRTPEVVGSRIRVTNSDGSSHVEEIVEWQPSTCLHLRMTEFSAPLSRWATAFDETWVFTRPDDSTARVTRTLDLHPRSRLGRVVLWLISFLLKAAIARHLAQIRL